MKIISTLRWGLLLILIAIPTIATNLLSATPKTTLVIATRIDDITSLDPAESFEFAGSDLNLNVYRKLVNFDPKNLNAGYKYDLANGIKVSADGKTITFSMRPNVFFNSGNPVSAKDAVYSFQRAILLKKTPVFILEQFGFTADNVKDRIKLIDDMTFSITMDNKYAVSFVLNCLTSPIGSIVDQKLVESKEQNGDYGNTWLKTHTAGSGAYVLVNWKPNDSYTLKASNNFYLGTPNMKKVIVRHVTESSTQRLLLEKGDIDIARNLTPQDIAGITKNKNVAVESDLRGRILYISLNQKDPFLSNPKVIEAFKYLVNYKGMEKSFLKGQYTVHQSFLPKTYLGSINDKPYSFDLAKAKSLLKGVPSLSEVSLEIIVREAQDRIDVAQSFQNALSQVGLQSNIVIGTGKQTLSKYRAREHQIYVGAWGPDYPDPNTNAATFAVNDNNSDEAKSTGILAWRNSWFIPELTKLSKAAVQELDSKKRAKMYGEIQRVHQKKSPFIIAFQQIEQVARRSNVKGFSIGSAISQAAYWNVTK